MRLQIDGHQRTYRYVTTPPTHIPFPQHPIQLTHPRHPAAFVVLHRLWGESLGRLRQNGQWTRGGQAPRHLRTSARLTVLQTRLRRMHSEGPHKVWLTREEDDSKIP